ncbi:carbohydrate ABC transporter permease, partial [Clostridioides difficile]
MNTLLALILPGLVAVFNIILLLNFFRTVPKDLEEAAFIDGAGHFQTFVKIYLPVSVPVIATVSLFMMVGHWNAYFDGIIYIRDAEKLPLATFMQTIIVQADMSKLDPEAVKNLSQRTIRASQIFISALPILLVYPFLQRYFVTGIVVGAVKE